MEKVIVTGGMGYIGSHTVIELINHGYEPIIVDNLCNSEVKVLDSLEKITGQRITFEEVDLSQEVETVQFFEKGVTIWKKDAKNNWKCVVDIWNIDPTIKSIYK